MTDAHSIVSGAADGKTIVPEPEVSAVKPFRRIGLDLREQRAPVPVLDPFGLYEGRMTVLAGEPEAGKSWLALWLAIRVMEQGGVVIYLDEEGGEDMIHERLVAMGADPDMVNVLFWYFAFESRQWSPEDLLALDQMMAAIEQEGLETKLVVLDSLPDFLAAAGWSEDSAPDVTTFVNTVLARFRDANIAQLVLDHLVKPTADSKRSRYARGSGAKPAKTGVGLHLEVLTPFDQKNNGEVRLSRTKDRHGRLTAIPRHSADSGLIFTVKVGNGTLELIQKEATTEAEYDPVGDVVHQIRRIFESAPAPIGQSTVKMAVRARNEVFRDAWAILVDAGTIKAVPGPRRPLLWIHSGKKS